MLWDDTEAKGVGTGPLAAAQVHSSFDLTCCPSGGQESRTLLLQAKSSEILSWSCDSEGEGALSAAGQGEGGRGGDGGPWPQPWPTAALT